MISTASSRVRSGSSVDWNAACPASLLVHPVCVPLGLTRQQLDDIMQERERQRDRLEAAAAAADRSVEIAQSYVVPAFERGA